MPGCVRACVSVCVFTLTPAFIVITQKEMFVRNASAPPAPNPAKNKNNC